MSSPNINNSFKQGGIKKAVAKKRVRLATSNPKKAGRSSMQSTQETIALAKIGRAASANAIRASKALGLSVTYMEKGVVYREHADGTKEIIIEAPKKVLPKKTSIPLKKGMVFHAKK